MHFTLFVETRYYVAFQCSKVLEVNCDFREEVVEGSKQEANQIPGIVRRIGGEQNVCFPSIPDYWPPLEIGNQGFVDCTLSIWEAFIRIIKNNIEATEKAFM